MTIKKTDLPEFIVIVLFSIYCVTKILFDTTQLNDLLGIDPPSLVRNVNIFLILGLSINLINLKSISIKKFYLVLFYLTMTMLVAYFSERETEIIMTLLFVLNGVFLKNSKYIKFYLWVSIFCVLITVFLTIFGIYEMDALIENRGIRLYFGFNYTTYLPNYFLHIVIAYISILKRNINILESVLILCINQLLFIFTDTKAVYILVILSILLLWVYRFFPYILTQNLFKIMAINITGVMAFISVYISYIYNPGNYYLAKINKALAGRLYLGNKAIKEYGFNLFGTFTEWVIGRAGIERSGEYFWVDSSYLNTLLSFGIVTFLLFVLCYIFLTKYSWEVKNYYLCFAVVLLAIHGVTDQQFFDITYSPTLLLLGPTLFGTVKDIIKPENW